MFLFIGFQCGPVIHFYRSGFDVESVFQDKIGSDFNRRTFSLSRKIGSKYLVDENLFLGVTQNKITPLSLRTKFNLLNPVLTI
jgi:hypothetical protein